MRDCGQCGAGGAPEHEPETTPRLGSQSSEGPLGSLETKKGGVVEGFIYFVGTSDSSFVKIGFSTKPRRRFLELGALRPSPFALDLLGWIPGDRALEAELHERFKVERDNGEWFKFSERLKAFIGGLHLLRLDPEPVVSIASVARSTAEKNLQMSELGKKGGPARAKALSAARRREIARMGAVALNGSLTAKQRRASAMKALLARWKRSKAA